MTRAHRSLAALAAGAMAAAACTSDTPAGRDVDAVRALHERILTIDTHVDIPSNFATPEVDPGVRGERQVDLPKMREGGLDAAFFAVYVGQDERTPEAYAAVHAEALAKFAAIHRMTEMYPEHIGLAISPADVVRLHEAGKLAACIGIENGYAIGRDLSLLQEYYDLGARYITLTHNGHNDIGDSSDPLPRLGDGDAEHGGLSPFGEDVVREMNRLGIMVDVSHVAKSTMLDAVRVSRAPVIASHSATKALADVSRNLDDEQLLALKANGGVIQVVGLGQFVMVDDPEKVAAAQAIRQKMGVTSWQAYRALTEEERTAYRDAIAALDDRWPAANVSDFVDHIDHAVQLIGIDHVGISSDFDGGGGVVGWNDASETLNVTLELARRGYTDAEIEQLWGANLLRVWREVEEVRDVIEVEAVGE
jgi:membrane dipeptidase